MLRHPDHVRIMARYQDHVRTTIHHVRTPGTTSGPQQGHQDTKLDRPDPQFERKKKIRNSSAKIRKRALFEKALELHDRLAHCMIVWLQLRLAFPCLASPWSKGYGFCALTRLLAAPPWTKQFRQDHALNKGLACTQEKLARIHALQVQITSQAAGGEVASGSTGPAPPGPLSLATLFGQVAPGSGPPAALRSHAPTTPTAPSPSRVHAMHACIRASTRSAIMHVCAACGTVGHVHVCTHGGHT